MSISTAVPADGQRPPQLPTTRAAAVPAAPSDEAQVDEVQAEATPEQVGQAVEKANEALQSRSVGVRFEMDRDAERLVVKVMDRESGEVLRQIPSEEVLRIAKVLGRAPGVLLSQSA